MIMIVIGVIGVCVVFAVEFMSLGDNLDEGVACDSHRACRCLVRLLTYVWVCACMCVCVLMWRCRSL